MKPVFQTKFGEQNGNCLQACIASILELELDDVPDFVADHGTDWFPPFVEWLRARGLGLLYFQQETASILCLNMYAITIHKTKPLFNGVHHAVVSYLGLEQIRNDGVWEWDGRIVHNPNPHCPGLNPAEEILIIVPGA